MIRRCFTILIFAVLTTYNAANTVVAADGDLDLTFNTTGFRVTDIATTSDDVAYDIAVQTDGKIVAMGYGNGRFCAVRYNTDGTLDTTFSGDGIATSGFTGVGTAGALQSDGKVIVAGGTAANTISLLRFTSSGVPDTTFDIDGQVSTVVGGTSLTVSSVLVQADGKIIAVGYRLFTMGDSRDIFIARYNSNGTPDNTFDGDGLLISNLTPGGIETANDAKLQADGKIVLAGSKNDFVTFSDFFVARYNADGSLDSSQFGGGYTIVNTNVGNNDFANSLAIGPDGKITAAGIQTTPSTPAIVRLHPNGSLDTSFDSDGILLPGAANANTADILVQPDGKFLTYGGSLVSKFNPDGTLDTSFSGDGRVTITGPGQALTLQPDGKILLTGSRTSGTTTGFFTARLQNTVAPPTAAGVSISGRVVNEFGSPLRNAVVVVIGGNLSEPIQARTGTFGMYRFDDLSAGHTYVVSVYSKRFTYQPQIITAFDEINNLDFTPIELFR